MVDSRQKGARAENAAKGILIKHTNLDWQRIPQSGALNKSHKLKGDLYIPSKDNKYCVEVKHYKDDHISSKLLTDKKSQVQKWWEQTIRESGEVEKEPLLIFKFDRSKWFVAFETEPSIDYRWLLYFIDESTWIYIAKLEEWLVSEDIQWIL
jgi:hypothetical protein